MGNNITAEVSPTSGGAVPSSAPSYSFGIQGSSFNFTLYAAAANMIPAINFHKPGQAATIRNNRNYTKIHGFGDKRRGSRPSPKIVNGFIPHPNEIPYVVNIRRKRSKDIFCGGSIITPFWILTAAHCMSGESANMIKIVAGDIRSSERDPGEQERTIDSIFINKQYTSPLSGGFDIALMKLSEPLIFNEYVKSIPLPTAIEKWEGDAQVSGYGLLEENGMMSSRLMTAMIPICPHSSCASVYEFTEITPDMICAGAEGKDSCQGDSGGPLACKNNTVLCGIVSFGVGCAEPGVPGVYTDVSYYKEWIDSTMLNANNTNTREEKCGSNYFYCPKDRSCISRKLICNNNKDCPGGSDEASCTDYPASMDQRNDPNLRSCNNGHLIPKHYFCDGDNDCRDGSDEVKCDFRGKAGSCNSNEFTCISNGRCIKGSWKEDGVPDCDDYSDELSGTSHTLSLSQIRKDCSLTAPIQLFEDLYSKRKPDYFVCNYVKNYSRPFKCVPNEWICDGDIDCPDGEDEVSCIGTTPRHPDYFNCKNGQRVRRDIHRCDGIKDCTDGSDEINCHKLDSFDYSIILSD